MRLLPALLVCCLSLTAVQSMAAEVKGLFDVREPVSVDNIEERNAAMSRALQTVVVRLTGNRQSANDARLKPLLADPQRLVQQFVYEGTPLTLSVAFDAASTEKALRDTGLTVWSMNRPQVLTWWLEQSIASGAHLLAEDQSDTAALREAGRVRGLPLSFPLGDLQEQLLATQANLSAADGTALRAASEGYTPEALLAVVAKPLDPTWDATWQLWVNGERLAGKATGSGRQALAENILAEVAEALAKRFAAGVTQSIQIEVQGCSLARYANLQTLLQPFQVSLVSIEGDKVSFRVQATAPQVRARLQTVAQLHEQSGATPASNNDTRLTFAW